MNQANLNLPARTVRTLEAHAIRSTRPGLSVGRVVLLGQRAIRLLLDPEVGQAWRCAGTDIHQAIDPVQQALKALLMAGRLTISTWRSATAS